MRMQDCPHRRGLNERDISVPTVVVGRVIFVIVQSEKFGGLGHAWIERMGVQRSKAGGKVAVLGRGKVLVLKEDHLVR